MTANPSAQSAKSVALIGGLVLAAVIGVSFTPLNTPIAAVASGVDRCAAGASGTFFDRTFCDPVSTWTFWLVLFTAALSLTSIVQLRMLAKTDATSRMAAEAAEKSANVADQAVHLTQRAYLRLSRFKFKNFAPDVMLSLDCQLINPGNTPARDANITISFAIDGLTFPSTFLSLPTIVRVGVAVYDRVKCNLPLRALTAAEHGNIASGSQFLYYVARIDYVDVFGKQHARGFAGAYAARGEHPPVFLQVPHKDHTFDF